MRYIESIAHSINEINGKISPERMERIEYRVTELDKAMSGLIQLAMVAVGLLAFIAWRLA